MKYLTSPLWLLTPDEMLLLHRKTVELLESRGVGIDHEGFLDALEAKGATIHRSERVARLPAELTEEAMMAMSGSPCLLKDDEQTVTEFLARRMREFLAKPPDFAFGGSSLEVLNEDGRTGRPARYQDLEQLIRFGNGHSRIKYVGGPPVLFSYDAEGREVPPGIREISGMAYMAKHCEKLGSHATVDPEDVDFAVRLCELLTNGTQAELDSPAFLAPFLGIRCSFSPLRIGGQSAETLYQFARRGLPLTLLAMPLAGGTTPTTAASTILIANAEILGLIAGLWAVGTESIHHHAMVSAIIDMRTGAASYASPNAVLQDLGLAQLHRFFYGLEFMSPTDYIDAKYPGYQSGSERAFKIAAIALGGNSYPSVGQLKAGLVCSPVQACLDIEAFDWMHYWMRGIEVSDESLCVDLIREQGIGGNFFETEHTLRHFREEFFLPKLQDGNSEVIRDMVEAARAEVNTILSQTPRYAREAALCAEIDRLYRKEVEKRKL